MALLLVVGFALLPPPRDQGPPHCQFWCQLFELFLDGFSHSHLDGVWCVQHCFASQHVLGSLFRYFNFFSLFRCLFYSLPLSTPSHWSLPHAAAMIPTLLQHAVLVSRVFISKLHKGDEATRMLSYIGVAYGNAVVA